MPDTPKRLSESDIYLVNRVLDKWPIMSHGDHEDAKMVFANLVESYHRLLQQQSPDDGTEHSSAQLPSGLIELQALVWGANNQCTIQELRDWGAPIYSISETYPFGLTLKISDGCNVSPGIWDIIVKYKGGRFAVFSHMDTASIFRARR